MWPPLPATGFTAGRPATQADVNAGNAVFVLQCDGEPIGLPLPIDLPQYALHVSQETGSETPCVLIQAEAANGQEIAGALYPNGGFGVGLLWEFKLLGKVPPDSGAAQAAE